jgi:hypothetical protein
MRRLRRFLLWQILPAAALLLAGCPYGSEFPLGSPAEAIPEAELLGAWKPSPKSEEDFILSIRSAGGAALVLTAESPGEEPAAYPAFISVVGEERFLNLREEGETERWYFANYRLEGDWLRLRLVDDELFASRVVSGAEERRAFLERHLEDPRLYGAQDAEEWDWVLERVGP